MNKIVFVSVILFIVSINADQLKPNVKIEHQTTNSITLTISIDTVFWKTVSANNKKFSLPQIPGFGSFNVSGYPCLPFYSFFLTTNENPDVKIAIISSVISERGGVEIYPAQQSDFSQYGDFKFVQNKNLYRSNSYFPEVPVLTEKTLSIRGVPVTKFKLSPILYNPVNKKVKIYRKITVKIVFLPCIRKLNLSLSQSKIISNTVLNHESFRKVKSTYGVEDMSTDVIIITVDKYLATVEKLVEWQNMKGFDVVVKSQASWNSSQIKAACTEIYNKTDPKPGYLLIVGDDNDVPAERLSDVYNKPYSDLLYASLTGDYLPEMGRGRISVSTQAEANAFVDKIIEYEKTPTTNSNFYKSVIGCAYFQDGDNAFAPDYYEDRAFVKMVEEATAHLDLKGYSTERVYFSKYPSLLKYWNNTFYANGGSLPAHLSYPTFQWDGSKDDIIKHLNNGSFIMYHYDHGSENGWGDPKFLSSDLSELSNSRSYPVIYSIDCRVGGFANTCFAEVITRMANRGAAGIVAATHLSYSGPNDALMIGLVDATWPGLIHKSPAASDPVVTPHEPIYIMGDILDQGLLRMSETWPDHDNYNDKGYGAKYHYFIYHYFGDPTMRIWTDVPEIIKVNHPNAIGKNATSFSLTNLNTSTGVVTLYDKEKKYTIGKSDISSPNQIVSIVNTLSNIGDSVIITITGQNLRPYSAAIPIAQNTGPVSMHKNVIGKKENEIVVRGSKVVFRGISSLQSQIVVLDCKGRNVLCKFQNLSMKGSAEIVLDFRRTGLPHGLYYIQCRSGNQVLRRKFIF